MNNLYIAIVAILIAGCSSSESSSYTPQPHPSTQPTECVDNKTTQYNQYTGEVTDVPCEPAAVAGEETPPDEPPTE